MTSCSIIGLFSWCNYTLWTKHYLMKETVCLSGRNAGLCNRQPQIPTSPLTRPWENHLTLSPSVFSSVKISRLYVKCLEYDSHSISLGPTSLGKDPTMTYALRLPKDPRRHWETLGDELWDATAGRSRRLTIKLGRTGFLDCPSRTAPYSLILCFLWNQTRWVS